MTSEFHRPVAFDRVGAHGLDVTVDATAAECAALAERMGIPGVHAVSCVFHLTRERHDAVAARGHLRAVVTQTCILSLEDFQHSVEEVFQVRFVPADQVSDDIDPQADDEIPVEGNVIDLGEAAAEQLGLALDPYPRMPGADVPEAETAAEPHPFAALAGLRRLN
ncbi:YceD family protein [Rhodopila sp.]|uniref:YceD family protein n=1 Tax=Rhodopila sp. TaxID=2480087 RepID=UPI003D0CEDAB